jgi:hypothetical protein
MTGKFSTPTWSAVGAVSFVDDADSSLKPPTAGFDCTGWKCKVALAAKVGLQQVTELMVSGTGCINYSRR